MDFPKKKFIKIIKANQGKANVVKVVEPELKPQDIYEKLPVAVQKIIKKLELFNHLKSKGESWVEFRYRTKPSLKSIPSGYYFKGGVAREELRRLVYPNAKKLNIRDIDLLRFTDADDSADHKLALEFMSNDYERGRGVEVAVDEADYFSSRDITINEVLCCHKSIKSSFSALLDASDNIFRPANHVIKVKVDIKKSKDERFKNKYIDYRTVPKILRLAAERIVHNIPFKIMDFPDEVLSTPFDVALQLNRSLGVSESVGNEYLMLLSEYGVVPNLGYPPSLYNLVKRLAPDLPGEYAFFRNLPKHIVQKISHNCE